MMTTELTIKRVNKVCVDTIEVSFTRPKEFDFKQGQYAQFSLPKLEYKDPKGNSRVFSIASAPANKSEVSIIFRQSKSGYKKTLSELSVGSKVLVQQPTGGFMLPNRGKHVFIAGGVGIAPFMSALRELKATQSQNLDITLLCTNRSRESAPCLAELSGLCNSMRNIRVVNVFKRVEVSDLESLSEQLSELNWWVVGPPLMVADVRQKLKEVGAQDSKIRSEEFIGY